MRSTWRLGKWRGIPITVHWTVFLGLPWFYYQSRWNVPATVVLFAGLFFLLVAHELGHAVMALWRKVQVHTIQLFFIHGVCTHDEPYDETDDVFIAWGGVAAQFLVLIIASIADVLLGALSIPPSQLWTILLRTLIETNIVIMIINLIPVAPLDGVKAWRVLPILREKFQQTSLIMNMRQRRKARQNERNKALEASSKQIAADIMEKLKKGKPDL